MRKRILLLILVMIQGGLLKAQTRAWLTDRFIVKTDLPQWLFVNAYNVELEMRLNRRGSLSLGFISGSKQHAQAYRKADYPGVSGQMLVGSIHLPDKGIINSRLVFLEYRIYGDAIVGGLRGVYMALEPAVGKADIKGEYPLQFLNGYNPLDGPLQIDIGPLSEYVITNANLFKLSYIIGYQGSVYNHLFIDSGVGLEYYELSSSGADSGKIMAGIARYYTPINLVGFIGSNNYKGLCVQMLLKFGYLLY